MLVSLIEINGILTLCANGAVLVEICEADEYDDWFVYADGEDFENIDYALEAVGAC